MVPPKILFSLSYHKLKKGRNSTPVKKGPAVPCAAKLWTCFRRLGLAPSAPPWPKPIALLMRIWVP